MAKVKTPFLSLNARGSIGDALTAVNRRGVNVVEKKPVPHDPYSLPQAYQRWEYQDYIALWHTLTPAQQRQWHSDAVSFHMSGFACFMRYYLKNLPDIAGRWRLDRAAGTLVPDSSRNSNTGTKIGAFYLTCLIGDGLHFDGIDDEINCGNDTSLRLTSDMSFEAFCRTSDASFQIVAARWNASREWELAKDDLHRPWSVFRKHSTAQELVLVGAPGLNDGLWHHWALTLASNTGTLYIDGAIEDSGNFPVDMDSSTTDLLIGRRGPPGTPYWWKGQLDHCVYYNRALSQADIIRHSERRYP